MSSSGTILRDHALVAVAAGELVALGDLALRRDEDADQVVDARRQVVARVAVEGDDVDDDAALAVRDLERGVADLARLLLEDRADQLLLGGQLGLALRRDLADEQVAGRRPRRRCGRCRARRGCAGDSSERFGMSRVISSSPSFVVRASISYSSMWIEVSSSSLNRRSGDDDRVLEVVALPGHEGDQAVLAERDLATGGRGAVGEHVAGLHLLADGDDRGLVDDRALVRAHELAAARTRPSSDPWLTTMRSAST